MQSKEVSVEYGYKSAIAHSNFDLKNTTVNLVSMPAAGAATLSLRDLEAFRSERRVVTASKHGLEVLCGGSCETGAQ
jgi:hypothetical protein